jgi:hypothetical protein
VGSSVHRHILELKCCSATRSRSPRDSIHRRYVTPMRRRPCQRSRELEPKIPRNLTQLVTQTLFRGDIYAAVARTRYPCPTQREFSAHGMVPCPFESVPRLARWEATEPTGQCLNLSACQAISSQVGFKKFSNGRDFLHGLRVARRSGLGAHGPFRTTGILSSNLLKDHDKDISQHLNRLLGKQSGHS